MVTWLESLIASTTSLLHSIFLSRTNYLFVFLSLVRNELVLLQEKKKVNLKLPLSFSRLWCRRPLCHLNRRGIAEVGRTPTLFYPPIVSGADCLRMTSTGVGQRLAVLSSSSVIKKKKKRPVHLHFTIITIHGSATFHRKQTRAPTLWRACSRTSRWRTLVLPPLPE